MAGATLLDFAVSPLFIWDTFTGPLSRDLNVSETGLTLVFSVSLATFSAGVVGGGRVADAVAPRWLAAVTGVGVVVGLGTAAVAPSLPILLVGFGVVLGAATGLGYATAVRVAGTAAARRGRAVAIVVSAYAAGAVVLAPVAAWLLAMIGRTGAFAVLAALLGAALAGAALLLPGAGQAPRGGAAPAAKTATRSPVWGPVPALWTMFLLGCAPALIAFGHAGELAGGPERTVIAVSLLNAGNFGGRLLAGPAADRIGYAPALHATAAALGGACLALTLSDHQAVTLTALLALGTQYGALSVLTPVATAAAVPADRFGAAFGAVFSGWGVAGLAGPVAAAWLATWAGYQEVAAALIALAVLAWGATVWVLASVRRRS